MRVACASVALANWFIAERSQNEAASTIGYLLHEGPIECPRQPLGNVA